MTGTEECRKLRDVVMFIGRIYESTILDKTRDCLQWAHPFRIGCRDDTKSAGLPVESAASKDTRVRVEDLSKIIARVLCESGA